MAAEKLQQILWQVIKDCPETYNILIMIVSADDAQANKKLAMNYDECEMWCQQNEVHGQHVDYRCFATFL